jgi:hypothetical protein
MAKTTKRKLKGMETAQAVLLLVIAVAITLALWLIVSGMLGSANAPVMQYDTSASYTDSSGNAHIYVRVGVTVNSVINNQATLYGPYGSETCSLATTTFPVKPGQDLQFSCPGPLGPGTYTLQFAYNNGQQASVQFYWAGS